MTDYAHGTPVTVGRRLPTISLEDLDGRQQQLPLAGGVPTLVFMWASW